MSALTVNLPDNLHEKAREVAALKNLSMDALVTIALTQSLSRLVAEPILEERAAKAWMSFWHRFQTRSRRRGIGCRTVINGSAEPGITNSNCFQGNSFRASFPLSLCAAVPILINDAGATCIGCVGQA